jgi:hypothetical protein
MRYQPMASMTNANLQKPGVIAGQLAVPVQTRCHRRPSK